VARWVYDIAKKRSDAEYELVDIADYHLPLLEEPMPPLMDQYTKQHTQVWSEKIAFVNRSVFLSTPISRTTAFSSRRGIMRKR
jgi:NAD(P)H-dependent FMN reductase